MVYCDDAPTLENKLHRHFDTRRVNLVNMRKEYFRVSLEEIRNAVEQYHGEFSLTLAAEAQEYRETVAIMREAEECQVGLKIESMPGRIAGVDLFRQNLKGSHNFQVV